LPWLDAVVGGEADTIVAPLFAALAAGERIPRFRTVWSRQGDEVVAGDVEVPRVDLDAIPPPDYQEFFATAAASSKLAVCASSIRVVSSRERKPRHQSSAGGGVGGRLCAV
jgi:hypothetical protein